MFLDKLNWRYATKKMDPSKPVSEGKVAQIVEAIRMAPTSSGLQPFHLFVIRNPELKSKLKAAANAKDLVTDSSHLLVFAAYDTYTAARIDEVVARHAAERPGTEAALDTYYSNLKAAYLPRDAQVNFEHAARQAYIALGFALAAAAELEVDSTPMEGFDAARFDDILGLADKGLKSVVALALGTRAAEGDWLAPLKKVRKPAYDLVTDLN
ncbi:NAD(P)H-dependent oxidoreductase [Celeribacter ethanolicus]|uniref:NAD(P)H-dependent oxidoreductase n=1 Tax=Celeribacter ethanolicus TaxID=1758178 RepID=A0A291GGA5_9RHOB|nr:nitroreductase family protein [Celeribacter ethanolicus]ATG49092.1 NAD(P)H-dependent oxidoreductase [Celeribacter ethanolicus]